jgi:membrane protease YdiL (CAAX protease family)
VLKLLLIVFLLVFPHFVPLPFYSYAVVGLVAIITYLRAEGKNLRAIGLKKEGLTIHAFLVGSATALLWVSFNKWVYHPFIIHFFDVSPYTEYDFIRKSLPTLLITIAAAWLIGGFYEELVFRGFIQSAFQQYLQQSRYSFWIAGIITSMLFGLYHWQQGVFGMIPAALGGLLWTFLLWRFKGNLWYAIISHAVYDTIALIMIYWGISI